MYIQPRSKPITQFTTHGRPRVSPSRSFSSAVPARTNTSAFKIHRTLATASSTLSPQEAPTSTILPAAAADNPAPCPSLSKGNLVSTLSSLFLTQKIFSISASISSAALARGMGLVAAGLPGSALGAPGQFTASSVGKWVTLRDRHRSLCLMQFKAPTRTQVSCNSSPTSSHLKNNATVDRQRGRDTPSCSVADAEGRLM